MKKLTTLAALVAAAFAGSAMAGFTGVTDPSNFAVANLGTLLGAATPGTANFSSTALSMVGSDSDAGCAGGVYGFLSSPCQLQVTIIAAGTFSFDWTYSTADGDGPPGDIFGVLVDGLRIPISDPGGAVDQAGSRTLAATSSFGWFINCTDCTFGAASANVSNLSFVPEPSSFALLVAGAIGLGASARRRKGAPR